MAAGSAPAADPINQSQPTARARAIAQGLIATGRAVDIRPFGRFIRVRSKRGPDYWVSHSGNLLLRGETPQTAEELQPGFLEAMARAGAPP